jgi:hypothetical protein
MATTAQGIADFTQALREVVQPYIQDNVPSQTKLLKVLKKNDNTEIFNNNFYVAIRSTRHGGISNLPNDKAQLSTGNAGLVRGTASPKILTATFDISDMLVKASKNDKLAVESAMQFQMETLTSDFSKQVNRQYYSDGVGALAMVSESSGSVGNGTVQIQYPNANLTTEGRAAPYYGTAAGGINADLKPHKYFAPGNYVGFGSAGTAQGTIAANGVTGGSTLGTLVLTGVTPFPASSPIYLLDKDLNAAGTSEIQGFRAALSEGTANYIGLTRSLDVMSPQFMGTAQNQALTINNMEMLYVTAYEYAKEGDRYAWFCNKSLYTKFGDMLTALRKQVNQTELISGWTGLEFSIGVGAKIPVILDLDAPDGEMFLINLDTWTVLQIADMSFIDNDAVRVPNYITSQKVFSWYTNLICRAPAANGRMVRQTR